MQCWDAVGVAMYTSPKVRPSPSFWPRFHSLIFLYGRFFTIAKPQTTDRFSWFVLTPKLLRDINIT